MAAAILPNSSASLTAFVLACLFVLGVYFDVIVESRRLARWIGERYELRDYNRGIVYVLFILAEITLALAVAMHIRAMSWKHWIAPADSMGPTLEKGDRFLANKLFERKLPHRGGVLPRRPGQQPCLNSPSAHR